MPSNNLRTQPSQQFLFSFAASLMLRVEAEHVRAQLSKLFKSILKVDRPSFEMVKHQNVVIETDKHGRV